MWSYKIVQNYYTTEDELNGYGSEGWELVTVSYHRLYFKKWVEPDYVFTKIVVETEVSEQPYIPTPGNIHILENSSDVVVNELQQTPTGGIGYTGPQYPTGWTGPWPVPMQDAEPSA